MKSRQRAKADVCFSKQRAPREDRDGEFMHTSGPRPDLVGERNVEARSVRDVASK